MDYKEKYESLISWLKQYVDKGVNITPTDIRVSVPELADSEDERIRKALIAIVKWFGADSSFFANTSKSSVLAWLEKQKEKDCKTFLDIQKLNHRFKFRK